MIETTCTCQDCIFARLIDRQREKIKEQMREIHLLRLENRILKMARSS